MTSDDADGLVADLSSAECSARAKRAIVKVGGAYMTERPLQAAAVSVGLSFQQLYVAGRAGVLGLTTPAVVTSALGFFAPGYVAENWSSALSHLNPSRAAATYAEALCDSGRLRFEGIAGLDDFQALAEMVLQRADLSGLPLVAAWRDLPPPSDAAGAVAQALQVLREFRGALHIQAVRACGLSPLAAILAGPDGPPRAPLLGWSVPPEVLAAAPDAGDVERHARAERLTETWSSTMFDPLSVTERVAFLPLV